MYNKIAPLILNAGKNASYSDVYVAQPDSLKENLAGKIFVLAEISAKKNEGRLIFNFLIEALENYYYNDEKILLRDKIAGLKLENIFEAALSKVNKDFNEFLMDEKIKINVPATSITIGVVFENKLYFSSFGKNRALLIYRHNEQYELINVETNATDLKENQVEKEFSGSPEANIFSSVISGEIPINSYFFFTSESLTEYLSNKEIMTIITKLPPIVATEQLKNILEKINTYVPFLGVLIKNTIGLNIAETKEEFEETLTTHDSISTLNNTEQKTEQILAPAGFINLTKIISRSREIFKFPSLKKSANLKIGLKKYFKPEENKTASPLPIDLGHIKSLNLARSDSFLVKEKIFFKKTPGEFFVKLKNTLQIIAQIFNPRNWLALGSKSKDWFKSLNSKNSLLFSGLILVVLIFFGSLIFTNLSHKKQAAQTSFNNLVAQIENGEDSINTRLAYVDENDENIRTDLITIQSLMASLPHEKTAQKNTYNRLNAKLLEISAKIQKIILVTQIEKTNDLTGLNLNSIFLSAGNIYASDEKNIYSLTVGSASSTKFEISGATNLSRAYQSPNEKGFLYFLNNNQILKFDLKKKTGSLINVANSDSSADLNTFKTYINSGKNYLYVLAKVNNQIYKYTISGNNFTSKTNWFKETVDLSQVSDLYVIDNNLYVLNNTGEVLKFYDGKKFIDTDKAKFNAPSLIPITNSVNKMFIGVKYIYLFDSTAKRLTVLNKTSGNLLNQYEVASLNNLKDFTVNEEGKLAYFLAEGGIYRINLNQ